MATDPTLPARLQKTIDKLAGASAAAYFVNQSIGPSSIAPPDIWRGRSAKRHHTQMASARADILGGSGAVSDLIAALEAYQKSVAKQLAAEEEARREAEADRQAREWAQQQQAPWQPWRPSSR